MTELAVNAANGTNSVSDRQTIQDEVDQLLVEIDRVAETTKFNETYLLKGDADDSATKVQAHDAGIAGKLIQNAVTGTFTMKSLTSGDTIKIAGVEYTISGGATGIAAGADAGKQISIDGIQYTVAADAASANADKNVLTAASLGAMVSGKSVVVYEGKTYYAGQAPNAISHTVAYAKIKTEISLASSIGADVGQKAIVSSATVGGNQVFTIQKATVTPKEALNFSLHVGADADMTNKIGVKIDSLTTKGLGIRGLNVKDSTGAAATYAIDAIADAVAKISAQRSLLGAVQNRLDHTINNLDNVVENTTAAESQIRDTDMATEMVKYSNNNVLAQAGQSMLAQSNQANQGVLSLLG